MAVESQTSEAVQLLANKVRIQIHGQTFAFVFLFSFSIWKLYKTFCKSKDVVWMMCSPQVLMMDAKSMAKGFSTILPEDADLTMFTIKDLSLSKLDQLVIMKILLKRKIATELLTTFLPTILLLLITFITIFFEADLFADAISVNLTIMLVMTTIFTSKIEELPPTSDMKMIDIWLIFCLVVPFAEVILRTTIECMTCRCNNCHQELGDGIENGKGRITPAWVNTVAPTKVAKMFLHLLC